MTVEQKNNENQSVIIIYIPKWALNTQRQVSKAKAFDF